MSGKSENNIVSTKKQCFFSKINLYHFSGDNIEIAKKVFEQMNIGHSAVMRRFSAQGDGLLKKIFS